jgi:Holliday junction resolvase-like predicted endonuclease
VQSGFGKQPALSEPPRCFCGEMETIITKHSMAMCIEVRKVRPQKQVAARENWRSGRDFNKNRSGANKCFSEGKTAQIRNDFGRCR